MKRNAYTCATMGIFSRPLGGRSPFVGLAVLDEPGTNSCRVRAAKTRGEDTSKNEQAKISQQLWLALSLAFFRSIVSAAASENDDRTDAKLGALPHHVGKEKDGGLICAREGTDDRCESQAHIRADRPIHV